MPVFMPNEQVDEDLLSFKTTFADETKGQGSILRGGWPDPPEFIAQVDEGVDLRWVVAIRCRMGCDELKYRDVARWLHNIDSTLHGMMQET